MNRFRDDGGFTLLEITIVLAVIAILGLILVPSVVDFLNETRLARAQNDVQVLAEAVTTFYQDTGYFPQYASPARNQKIQLLVSPGDVGSAEAGAEGWTAVAPDRVDLISNHLVNNKPMFGAAGYPFRTTSGGNGWNGPYIMNEIGPDPWGNRYVINVEHLALGNTALEADGIQEKRAVWVLSAGPDGVFDTLYPNAGSQLIGSASASPADISARIQ